MTLPEGFVWPTLKQVKIAEGKRVYEHVDGERFPSITTVLSSQKRKKEALAKWRKRVGEAEAKRINQRSTKRGSSLHKLCENYLIDGQVAIETYQERENFAKIRPWLDSEIYGVYAIEQAMYSRKLGVAGSCDLIANIGADPPNLSSDPNICFENAVIDFKTAAKPKYKEYIRDYFLQGTAYACMFEELTGIAVPRVTIIIAVESEQKPQIFNVRTRDWIDPLHEVILTYKESIHVEEIAN